MHNGKWIKWLVITAMLLTCITGCDKRGPYERAVDDEIAKIEHDPHLSQSDKDAAIILNDALKIQARALDERIAAMTPAERDAFERAQRMQDQIERDQHIPR